MLAMKKLILILAVVAFATTAWAQETPKKPSFAGFVSNGFWDNWEMSLGGGVGTALTNGSNSGSFGKRLGFEANFSLVKWVHPVVGMRLQLQGGQFANYDADLGKLKWPYLFVHSDFMLNFSNWAGGYRDDRAYYLVPFVGFGYLATNFTDKSQEDNMTGTHQAFAFSYGLLNKFRLSRSFDFNIELKGMLAPSRVCPAKTDGSYLFGFSATAGFTYRFNKRGWQRGVAGYTAADIQAFRDAVAASMKPPSLRTPSWPSSSPPLRRRLPPLRTPPPMPRQLLPSQRLSPPTKPLWPTLRSFSSITACRC